jgi:hypothetical protein
MPILRTHHIKNFPQLTKMWRRACVNATEQEQASTRKVLNILKNSHDELDEQS